MRRIVKLRFAFPNRQSMRIMIPVDIQRELGWTVEMTIMLTTDEGKLIITKEEE